MRPRKRFGQHFLHDTAILQAIADAMALAPQQRVFEIGPGQGALTQYLHRPDLQRYLAVEIDRDLAPLLQAKFPGIEVLQQDILRTDMVAVLGKDAQPTQTDEQGWRVVGNLPYNISSPLLMQLIDVVLAQPHSIKDMHFMLQKEMAERLSAVPGSKAWGRLSVMTQVTLDVQYLFDVPPESFRPPPKVDSSVIRLIPKHQLALPVTRKSLDQVLRLAFAGRRKRMSNALKSLALDWQQLPVDPALRADDVTIEAFLAIAAVVEGSVDTDSQSE
jgi:16S rRNA (adenine1518-N6/adenine1519-N6)-dimethyltransferase